MHTDAAKQNTIVLWAPAAGCVAHGALWSPGADLCIATYDPHSDHTSDRSLQLLTHRILCAVTHHIAPCPQRNVCRALACPALLLSMH